MTGSSPTAVPGPQRPLPSRTRHLVVGAGFAGLATAIRLRQGGETDVVVVEKGSEVGGTWRDNTYPGAACDVPSQLYSLSFAPNPDWSMSFSPQPEIQDYLRRVAREHGVLDRCWFDTELEQATYDEDAQRWRVRTSRGDLTSETLVTGSGGLSEPRMPAIEGLGSFRGPVFHTARWDHDVDLAGRRVAVIGTGASAVQVVPELQRVVSRLFVHQRTPAWVIPRHDREYSRLERRLFRAVPAVQRAYRTAIYWGRELYVPGFVVDPRLAEPARRAALANIRRGIADPRLRELVTPTFRIGCKRVLISNDYYPALAAPNTELVTDPITRITPTGVVTADGTEREVDVVVVATGFHTTDLPIAHRVVGRDGRSLAETWAEGGMAAYKGTTVSGFPNLFMIVGPNVGLGHSSMVFMIESQVAYITDVVATMRRRGYGAVEPTARAQRAWNDDLQRRMRRSVWNTGGCSSWYLDEKGRNTTLWPRTTFAFRRRLRRFDEDAYVVEPARTDAGRGVPA